MVTKKHRIAVTPTGRPVQPRASIDTAALKRARIAANVSGVALAAELTAALGRTVARSSYHNWELGLCHAPPDVVRELERRLKVRLRAK